MKLELKWSYLDEGTEREFVQSIYISKKKHITFPQYCIGEYLVNLENAKYILNKDRVNEYRDNDGVFNEFGGEWVQIAGDFYTERNARVQGHYLFFDAVACAAFCTFHKIKNRVKEIFKSAPTEMEALQDYLIGAQWEIDDQMLAYNALFLEISKNNGEKDKFDNSVYRKLIDMLWNFNDEEHTLIGKYLSEENDGRCFATYIVDGTDEKYVSFSGLLDSDDCKIKKWLGSQDASGFITLAQNICRNMGAVYVSLNNYTRVYRYDYAYRCYRQGQSIYELYEARGKSGRHLAKNFSCCERKILGNFRDKTPDGSFYVKLPVCEKCTLGIFYNRQSGSQIKVYEGLMV